MTNSRTPGGFQKTPLECKYKMKVSRFDVAANSSFFPRFALGGLAVRHRWLGSAFRKRPLATAVGIHQEELDRIPLPPVTHCGYLQRKREIVKVGAMPPATPQSNVLLFP